MVELKKAPWKSLSLEDGLDSLDMYTLIKRPSLSKGKKACIPGVAEEQGQVVLMEGCLQP